MSGGNGGGYKGGGNMGAPKMFAGGAPGNFNMQPQTGGLEPMLPPSLAGTGGVKSPYGPYGPPGFIPDAPAGAGNPQGLTQQMPLTPNNPAWFNSPQGMAQQWQAGVGNSPLAGFMPNGGRMPTPGARMASIQRDGGARDDGSAVNMGNLRGTGSPEYAAAVAAQQAIPYWQKIGFPSEQAWLDHQKNSTAQAFAAYGQTPYSIDTTKPFGS